MLHGIRPFSDWHAEHHLRPTALICTPTWMSATLIATLIFRPALWLPGPWPAGAVAFGVLSGHVL